MPRAKDFQKELPTEPLPLFPQERSRGNTYDREVALVMRLKGASCTEIARRVGVDFSSVKRWLSEPEPARILEAYKRETHSEKLAYIEEIKDLEISNFRRELEEYRAEIKECTVARLELGKEIIRKVRARLEDLPEEAIAPKDMPALIQASEALISSALDDWSRQLEIEGVLASAAKATEAHSTQP